MLRWLINDLLEMTYDRPYDPKGPNIVGAVRNSKPGNEPIMPAPETYTHLLQQRPRMHSESFRSANVSR
jgi:hypothetical protein